MHAYIGIELTNMHLTTFPCVCSISDDHYSFEQRVMFSVIVFRNRPSLVNVCIYICVCMCMCVIHKVQQLKETADCIIALLTLF